MCDLFPPFFSFHYSSRLYTSLISFSKLPQQLWHTHTHTMVSSISHLFTALALFSFSKGALRFLTHPFAMYPFLFVAMGLFLLLAVLFLSMLAAKPEILMFVGKEQREAFANLSLSKSPLVLEQKNDSVKFRFDPYLFFSSSFSLTAVYAMALLCCVAWLVTAVNDAWYIYALPLWKDFLLCEEEMWSRDDCLDLRGRTAVPVANSKN